MSHSYGRIPLVISEPLLTFSKLTAKASLKGYAYAWMGHYIHKNAHQIPHCYAIWFAAASIFHEGGRRVVHCLLGSRQIIDQTVQKRDLPILLLNRFRVKYWKLALAVEGILTKIDTVISPLLKIRRHSEINAENVEQASFIEMCRYRVGSVVKLTISSTISYSVTHHYVKKMGWQLPERSIPLLLIANSVVFGILLNPALHKWHHFLHEHDRQSAQNEMERRRVDSNYFHLAKLLPEL